MNIKKKTLPEELLSKLAPYELMILQDVLDSYETFGYALGYEDGEAEGYDVGYNSGFNEGWANRDNAEYE